MKYLFFIIFIIVNVQFVHSQNDKNYQIVTNDYESFMYNGMEYEFKGLENIIKSNQSAYSSYKKSKLNGAITKITALLGGALIGYSTVSLIRDYKKTDILFMASGASLIGVSYVFHIRKNKKIKQSVSRFNKSE
ncbi:hypothetical protein SAMN05661096_01484 [Marivirga sericea]|uniref:Uncharacterized protein n=1 Tax=Marivirga sericea TaxID=1028 RepID=A0A1X7JB14_9BACT|nr:hypothetical protein [Marivirga sericea]SMG24747.1 hypothetical protein SAMN05661096_01484 [Marivirga sericea]